MCREAVSNKAPRKWWPADNDPDHGGDARAGKLSHLPWETHNQMVTVLLQLHMFDQHSPFEALDRGYFLT